MKAKTIKSSLRRKLLTERAVKDFREMKSRRPALASYAGPTDIQSVPCDAVTAALIREFQDGQKALAGEILTLGWADRLSGWARVLHGVSADDALMTAQNCFLETLKAVPQDVNDVEAWVTCRLKHALRQADRRNNASSRHEVPCRPDGEEERLADSHPDPAEDYARREEPDPAEELNELVARLWEQLPEAQRSFLERMDRLRSRLPDAVRAFMPGLPEDEVLRMSDRLRHRRNRLIRTLRRRLREEAAEVQVQTGL